MVAGILSIGTALPDVRLRQDEIRDLFARQPGRDRRTQRLIAAAFDAAQIDTRHTVLAELGGIEHDGTAGLRVHDGERLLSPSTFERNEEFRRSAPALFAAAAREALEGAGMPPSAVTHVVTVSCTGLIAPGPDYRLVRDLGLAPTVERYHLGFVGCAAAVPALRTAARIVAAQPEAVVLVACAELCSLHLQLSDDPQQIVAASVFADGAAAAIVAGPGVGDDPAPRLDLVRFGTTLTTEGEDDMVWSIGDAGFLMTLTPEVPRILGREIRAAVDGFLGDDADDVTAWAVHPGGRSILDKVSSALDLGDAALASSRRVLREYGNMSSATILFILRDLLTGEAPDAAVPDGGTIVALAFGPGLTAESALLVRRDGAV